MEFVCTVATSEKQRQIVSKEIVLLVGLPGSGKSTLGQLLAAEKGIPFLDDLSTTLGRQALLDILQDTSDEAKGCIVADVFLCEEPARAAAQRLVDLYCPTAKATWKFFENAPEKCRRNVQRRQEAGDTRQVDGSIQRFSKTYVIPKDAEVLIVWSD